MKMPDNMRPVCVCGDKMVLVQYEHYYGEARFWDCDNKNCQMNDGKEYMYSCDPDRIDDSDYQ